MAGSVANPVSLDPFRTIVEAHWNNVTHIAFYIEAGRDTSTSETTFSLPTDPGSGSRTAVTSTEWANDYSQILHPGGDSTLGISTTVSDRVFYSGPSGETAAATYAPYLYRSSAWVSVSSGDLTVDGGLPAITASGSYNTDSYRSGSSPPHPVPDQGLWKTTAGGSGSAIDVPGVVGTAFDQDTSPYFINQTNMVVAGSPVWVEDSPFFMCAYPVTGGLHDIYNVAYPASGIVVRYGGKAYRCIATKLQVMGVGNDRMWILCARSPSDD